MGYYVEQNGFDFFIDKKHFPDVIKAIHNLANYPDMMGGGSYEGEKTISKHYSWVNMNFSKSDDLKNIFNCWRWNIDFDDEGNIADIFFDGEKLGDDRVLLDTIAPFVKHNSFIQMRGEDNDMWRWVFRDGKCFEMSPRIIWD